MSSAEPVVTKRALAAPDFGQGAARHAVSHSLRELYRALRVLGPRRLARLRRAHRLAWTDVMNGFYTTRIVQTMFNVGFFDELTAHGSIDPAAFAAERDFDAGVLVPLADALYALRLLDRGGRGYVLSPEGRLIAEVGRGWFDGVYGYEGVFHQLEALVRKERRYGRDLTRDAVFVAQGSGEIENWVYFPLAIDAIKAAGARHVLDLGCGEGTFLARLCEQVPDVTGHGIDLAPEAVATGTAKLEAAGLGARVRLEARDLRTLDRAPDALRRVGFATCFFVLHELRYDGEACVLEFLRTFQRLFPGVPLMVFEVDRPSLESMRSRPGMAIPYYLQHDLSRQTPLAAREWAPLYVKAGFTRIDERRLGFASSVIHTVS